MPSVCRAGVRRRVFKARVVGSKLTFGCGLETYGYWLTSLIAATYRTALLPAGACPPLIDHTSHLHDGSHHDLTPTHYGIGSETPNLKPTGFKSVTIRLRGCKRLQLWLVGSYVRDTSKLRVQVSHV